MKTRYYNRSDYPEIVSAFTKYPDICSISERAFQFKIVGILCVNSQPIVVFPKNYLESPEASIPISEAKTLAKVLLRYRSEIGHDEYEMQLLYGNSDLSSNRIASAMFLLEDYCQNGFITRQTEISATQASDRIDWAATINKSIPLLSRGRPVYTNPIVRKRVNDSANIVCLAHRFVVRDCFKEWGWFFGFDNYQVDDVELPTTAVEVIRLLNAELRKTYLEREVLVIQNIIKYISQKYGIEQSQKLDIMATPYFSFVWEAICGYLFKNQYSKLKSLLPQPVWESDVVKGNISQRPDIFHVRQSALYILDAKYYNYNHNIPGWHDVVKQLFYRHSLSQVSGTREYYRLLPTANTIYNAFIFPGNTTDLAYVGRVHVPKVQDLGEIRAFAINQKKGFTKKSKVVTKPIINSLDVKSKLSLGKRVKAEAIQYVKSKGINIGSNTSYSVKQKGRNEYWANPNTDMLDTDWFLILNNNVDMVLTVISIPANTICLQTTGKPGLYVRNDKSNRIDLNINIDTLVDRRSGIDFSKYVIERLAY